MPKDEIDKDNILPYKNTSSQNLEANKEIQKKIDNAFKKASEKKYEQYENELSEKNTYFTRSKIPNVNLLDQTMQKSRIENNFKLSDNQEDKGYCQKCPTYKQHCPHKYPKEQLKEKFNFPIVTNSTYGWLKPYDNLGGKYNITSVTKSFYDKSHL